MNPALMVLVSHISRDNSAGVRDIASGQDFRNIQLHSVMVSLDCRFFGNAAFRLLGGEDERRQAGQRQQGK